MTTQPDNDSAGPEEYVRRLKAGDEILYLPEAAAFVRKSLGTLRYYRHLGIGPRSFRHGRNIAYWNTDLILWLAEEAAQPAGRSDGAHALARPQVGRSGGAQRRTPEARCGRDQQPRDLGGEPWAGYGNRTRRGAAPTATRRASSTRSRSNGRSTPSGGSPPSRRRSSEATE